MWRWEQIDFEGLEFEVLEIKKNAVISKELNFVFKQPTVRIIFQIKMTENLKILKTARIVRDHKGNI